MASKLYGFDQVNNFADSNISQLSYYKNFNPNQSIQQKQNIKIVRPKSHCMMYKQKFYQSINQAQSDFRQPSTDNNFQTHQQVENLEFKMNFLENSTKTRNQYNKNECQNSSQLNENHLKSRFYDRQEFIREKMIQHKHIQNVQVHNKIKIPNLMSIQNQHALTKKRVKTSNKQSEQLIKSKSPEQQFFEELNEKDNDKQMSDKESSEFENSLENQDINQIQMELQQNQFIDNANNDKNKKPQIQTNLQQEQSIQNQILTPQNISQKLSDQDYYNLLTPLQQIQIEKKKNYKETDPVKRLRNIIKEFKQNRQKTLSEQIQIHLKKHPQQKEKYERDRFIKRKCYKMGTIAKEIGGEANNVHIQNLNNQLTFLEEVFEESKKKKNIIPGIKELVLFKMNQGLARPQFLKSLEIQKREIDNYLKKSQGSENNDYSQKSKIKKNNFVEKVQDYQYPQFEQSPEKNLRSKSKSQLQSYSTIQNRQKDLRIRKISQIDLNFSRERNRGNQTSVFDSTSQKINNILHFGFENKHQSLIVVDQSDRSDRGIGEIQSQSVIIEKPRNQKPEDFELQSTKMTSNILQNSNINSSSIQQNQSKRRLFKNVNRMQIQKVNSQNKIQIHFDNSQNSIDNSQISLQNQKYVQSIFQILQNQKDKNIDTFETQFQKIEEQLYSDYKYQGDKKLDSRNKVMKYLENAKKMRLKSSNRSLSTLDAQMKQINNLLMLQNTEEIRQMYKNFVQSQSNQKADVSEKEVNVFERLLRDSKERDFKHNSQLSTIQIQLQ